MNRNYFIHSITKEEFDSIIIQKPSIAFNIDRINELVGYKVLPDIKFKIIRNKDHSVLCVDLYIKLANKN